LIGDEEGHAAVTDVERHADHPPGGGGGNGVLHEVGGDQAEQAAAMAVDIGRKLLLDDEIDALLRARAALRWRMVFASSPPVSS